MISLSDLVVAITLLLTISAVMIPLARWLGIGPEHGLLLSGIILGSSQFLNASQIGRLTDISQLGVVFFLFVIGLELDPRKIWSLRRYAFWPRSGASDWNGLVMMLYGSSSRHLGLLRFSWDSSRQTPLRPLCCNSSKGEANSSKTMDKQP